MNTQAPLTPGERYLLAERINGLLESRRRGDEARSARIEQRLATVLGRHYRGRYLTFAGLIVTVGDGTPPGRVDVFDADSLG